VVEHGYGSLKLYPKFSLHASIIADIDEENNDKINILLIDYMVEHMTGLEVFIALHRDGRYKIFVKYYDQKMKKRIRKKIVEGIGEKIRIGDKSELDVFLDHFEIFIAKYLQMIVSEYSDVLPDYYATVIRDILHYLQS